ncbi:MAG TPA: ParB/RepB/Spo0J family partition protein, partial [Nitrospirota bacterium]
MNTNTFKTLPIAQVHPSANNYRKTMDKKALKELAESIKTKGILQPILVRPLADGGYEIVAGHRRHQAALTAKLEEIPVMVRDLTDQEALEVQVIENCQREDPNPMEEAWGFKALLELGSHTTETLAAKLDRSPGYVLSRLKLLDIPEAAQKKIASGDIPLGHALLLTRLKHPSEQKEFLKDMTSGDGLTLSAAQSKLKQYYSLRLEDAVFGLDDCAKCSYRSSNQAALFPDLKKTDECTDRGCFFAKTRDHYIAILKEREEQGFKVITEPEAINRLRSWENHKVQRITPGRNTGDRGTEVPKRYKSECMKCADSHVFYMAIEEHYGGRKQVVFGEACLNIKCFNKMQKGDNTPATEQDSTTPTSSLENARIKARECRDRFLRSAIPAKVEASVALQKRFILYRLLEDNGFRRGKGKELSEIFGLRVDPSLNNYPSKEKVYNLITKVSEAILDEVLARAVKTLIRDAETEVMLNMTPEAGIDMAVDFVIDEDFVKTKTKADLVE